MQNSENPVDSLFEKIAIPLFSNPQLTEIMKNAEYSSIIPVVFSELFEIINLHTVFIKHYVPTATKLAIDTKEQISTSKYSQFYKNRDSFDKIVDEIVRVGYVKLYHRFEHFQSEFTNELSKKFDPVLEIEKINFRQFIFKYFKLEISNPNSYPLIKRINWIANCEKHYNGYPRKKNPPKGYEDADKQVKLKISPDQLGADILSVAKFLGDLFLTLLFAGQSMHFYAAVASRDELTNEQKEAMSNASTQTAERAFAGIKRMCEET